MTNVVETPYEFEDNRTDGILPWVGALGQGAPGGIERRRNLLPDNLSFETAYQEEDSTGLLDEYLEVRDEAAEVDKTSGEALRAIQHDVGNWLIEQNIVKNAAATSEEYSYDHPLGARKKIVALINHLAIQYGPRYPDDPQFDPLVSGVELEASRLFLRSAYAIYESTPKDDSIHLDEDGSFAFLVPARMSRKNTEYGAEVESVIPAFRYIPNEMRATMMLGLPPFVIDTYPRDTNNRRGYLIFVPVYPDSRDDLAEEGIGAPLRIARQKVDSAVRLAHNRLGADLIGLGAMLPSMTNYGRSIEHPGVITTSGHGGTVQLILETIKRAVTEKRITPDKIQKIGVLGLGAIGGSIAQIVKEIYPSSDLFVYDTKEHLVRNAEQKIGAIACANERELLESSGITIAALPDVKMDLVSLGVDPSKMEGKLIIDDSQPAVFTTEQVEKFGAKLAWVVGESSRGIVRKQYTYGDTLVGQMALFGCEAEVAALAEERKALQARGKTPAQIERILRRYAINAAVKQADVHAVGRLFKKHRISAAPLQAAGALI